MVTDSPELVIIKALQLLDTKLTQQIHEGLKQVNDSIAAIQDAHHNAQLAQVVANATFASHAEVAALQQILDDRTRLLTTLETRNDEMRTDIKELTKNFTAYQTEDARKTWQSRATMAGYIVSCLIVLMGAGLTLALSHIK